MLFALTDEEKMVQETAAKFARSELEPVAAELDRGKKRQVFLDNLKKLAELGFMGLNIRQEYGGSEASTVAFSLAMTELGRACAATTVTTSVTNMVAGIIQSVGSEALKSTYLPRLCSGAYAAAGFGLTEDVAGSDAAAIRTTAVADGDGWVLNGRKIFITSGAYAGVFIIWAVTDKTAPRGKGISAFLVEPGFAGFKVGKDEEKMGQVGSATNELIMEDCRVPRENLLGELNRGYHIALTELGGGRIGIGSMALGIGLAAMDYARDYAKERLQFGHPIARYQAIQWMLADRYTELEAARLLLLQAAHRKDQGKRFARESSMAKLYATEAANRACYDAMQILGGYGYMKEYPLERYARDVRVCTIYEGTSEIQRRIIVRELLR
ncbi:MAG: acyl-CoA dehydrogenase family protein [Deltaproteobacteria bacterium]|nr:acyl-CoA dehydrogenase family protein [Deltaproteobacteria bacterium]MBW2072762.1 acyl-CoA dehydrogenase family protein [Deltaproteobacteria bacterium]